MILHLASDEFYPVLHTRWLDSAREVDVPDTLATEFLEAERAFWQAQTTMKEFLRAVQRDETAYRRAAEVTRRRLERGRRRPFRRSRPEVTA